ncbi:MAG: rhodanese-like domain-containing protein [Actinomycetota bacterium]|nr:rhodanese-like domain-containing protein [Actinomycetota bacterium]
MQPTDATIDAAELRQLVASDPAVRVLDVRTPGEFESTHIRGSYNVPLDLLGEHARDLGDVEHPIVLVCQSGARASRAQERLNAEGKTNLHVLRGGVPAWEAAGGEVVRRGERWALDRQVRGVAGAISLASILTSLVYPPALVVAGFVAAGLTFSAVTNTCALGMALSRLPYNRGPRCDIEGVLREMELGPAGGAVR